MTFQLEDLLGLLVLGLAVGASSYLIANGVITQPIRDWFEMMALSTSPRKTKTKAFWQWSYKLIRCPYCVSHWAGIVAVAVYRPRPIVLWWPTDLIVSLMAIVVLAMLGVVVIRRAMSN